MQETPPGLQRDQARLVGLFRQAEREVERELARAVTAGNLGTAAGRGAKRREIRGILAELSTLSAAGNAGEAAGPGWDLIRTAYRLGSDRAIEGAGELITERGFTGMHLDTAQTLYDELSGRLEDSILYASRKVDDTLRRAALDELLQGTIQGRGGVATSQEIARRLSERGLQAFTDSRGHNWSLGNYAEMVTRTVGREAHTAGTINRLAENGLDLVKISEHVGSCHVCEPYQGEIFSISGGDTRYAPLRERPPYHPNCRHVTTPWVERFNLPEEAA